MNDLSSTGRTELEAQVRQLAAEKVALTEALRICTTDRKAIAQTLDGAQGRESLLKQRNDKLREMLEERDGESRLAFRQVGQILGAQRGAYVADAARRVIEERDAAQAALRELEAIVGLPLVANVGQLFAASKEALHLLGAMEGETLEAAAERVVKERAALIKAGAEAAGFQHRIEGMRSSLGASDLEFVWDAAERVARERDAAIAQPGDALHATRVALGAKSGERTEAAAARVMRDLDDAVLERDALKRAQPIRPEAFRTMLAERDQARECVDAIRRALGVPLSHNETTFDMAKRIAHERQHARDVVTEARRILEAGETESNQAAAERVVRERNEAVAEDRRLRNESAGVLEALYDEKGETPVDAINGLKRARDEAVAGLTNAQTEINHLKVAAQKAREIHDQTARRDAETRGEAAIFKAQVEERDATIRSLQVALARATTPRQRMPATDGLETPKGGTLVGGGA